MSARKLTKKKIRQRRAIMFFLTVVFIVVGVVLTFTVFFKVTDVVVEGELSMYTAQQVKDAAGIKNGTNLFRIHAREREEQIGTTLLYIETVKITRKLPGTVVIHVEETTILLEAAYESGYIVLSDHLKILDITTSPKENAIQLTGVVPVEPVKGEALTAENAETLSFLQKLLSALDSAQLLENVTAIDITDKLNYALIYDNRLQCMIGTANNLDYKIQMLQELVNNRLSETETGFVDLSTAGNAIFKAGSIFENEETENDDESAESGDDQEETDDAQSDETPPQPDDLQDESADDAA